MGKEDYKNEKKGHGFLCVPKELLFDNRYKQLTIEAILLYAYMLDRLKLSIENGWKDSDGKVFIYTQEELTKKKHSYELEPSGYTVVCLDYAQSGIGSNSCGPVLSEKYQLNQNHFEFDMTLIWK